MSTTSSRLEVEPESNPTSHFLDPCIFHKLNLSLPPSRVITANKSLSGHHDAGSKRVGKGSWIVVTERKEVASMDYKLPTCLSICFDIAPDSVSVSEEVGDR